MLVLEQVEGAKYLYNILYLLVSKASRSGSVIHPS
jgi:hypothetical protein